MSIKTVNLNTQFIILNTKIIIVYTQFIDLNTKGHLDNSVWLLTDGDVERTNERINDDNIGRDLGCGYIPCGNIGRDLGCGYIPQAGVAVGRACSGPSPLAIQDIVMRVSHQERRTVAGGGSTHSPA